MNGDSSVCEIWYPSVLGVPVLAVPGKADHGGFNNNQALCWNGSQAGWCPLSRVRGLGLTHRAFSANKAPNRNGCPSGKVCPSARSATSAD